jgi:proton-dependent oligopeptide transporter, POT family
LFKGNLQAVVGQMYDDPKYSKVSDTAFMIFYMGINIGAFFAPFVATGVRNWFLKTQGFVHDGSLPAMCHAYNNGTLERVEQFQFLADKVSGQTVADLSVFATDYINAFSKGYNYAFGIAAVAMVISLVVYIVFNKFLPSVSKVAKQKNASYRSQRQPGKLPSIGWFDGCHICCVLCFAGRSGCLVWRLVCLSAFVAMMFQISTKDERPKGGFPDPGILCGDLSSGCHSTRTD